VHKTNPVNPWEAEKPTKTPRTPPRGSQTARMGTLRKPTPPDFRPAQMTTAVEAEATYKTSAVQLRMGWERDRILHDAERVNGYSGYGQMPSKLKVLLPTGTDRSNGNDKSKCLSMNVVGANGRYRPKMRRGGGKRTEDRKLPPTKPIQSTFCLPNRAKWRQNTLRSELWCAIKPGYDATTTLVRGTLQRYRTLAP
jgi:hypothetical protein